MYMENMAGRVDRMIPFLGDVVKMLNSRNEGLENVCLI